MRPFIYTCALLVIAAMLGLYLGHILFQPYLFICGGALTGLGVWILRTQVIFLRSSRLTYGELIEWKEAPAFRPGKIPHYYAVVAFQAVDGTQHQVTSATGTWPKPKTPLGKRLPVRYDPENPDGARLDTLFDYWGPPVIITLFGAVVLVISFVAAHARR
jgi:hypothetical protein